MHGERLASVLCTIGILVGAAAAHGADRAYDFKGIQLGISQAEFRKVPYPDLARANAKVVCAGDVNYSGSAIHSDDEDLSEVTLCMFSASLAIGGSKYISTSHAFYFATDPKDHIPKLYRIVLPTNVDAMQDVISALTDKFGQPTNVSTGIVQNKLGNRFSQKTYRWTNSASQIPVQGPWAEMDRMVVIYRLLSLEKFVSDQARARQKAQKNRM